MKGILGALANHMVVPRPEQRGYAGTSRAYPGLSLTHNKTVGEPDHAEVQMEGVQLMYLWLGLIHMYQVQPNCLGYDEIAMGPKNTSSFAASSTLEGCGFHVQPSVTA